jgi:predicted dehydrogenase
MKSVSKKLTRRQFTGLLGAASLFTIVPRHVLGGPGVISPNDKINLAGIGVGGQGGNDLHEINGTGGVNIVALCDVDDNQAAETFKKYPDAKRYKDFRKMFDEMEKQIDAVLVATPDHTHAVAAIAAIKRGKHVYCEKPLAHSIHEVRELMKAAKEHNIVSQLGNQGHSYESCRILCEWIWDGAIGKVHTIDCGCEAINSGLKRLGDLKETPPVPGTLDWDLWLGPAKERPYHPAYLPGKWRGWTPFGNGTIGDWTCHVVDPVFWALDLGAPKTILAEVSNYDFKTQGDAYPWGEKVTFEFPATDKRGPITLNWHSGTREIPRPLELESNRKMEKTGAVVIGDKGVITYGSHGAGGVRLIPEAKMKEYKRPAASLPRVKSHHQDWIDAIRNGQKAGSDFSYGGPLTELALLGIIAVRFPGQKLEWDAKNMKFPNCPDANYFLNPPYRAGWNL